MADPTPVQVNPFLPAKQAQFLEALALWGNARAACKASSVSHQTVDDAHVSFASATVATRAISCWRGVPRGWSRGRSRGRAGRSRTPGDRDGRLLPRRGDRAAAAP